MITNVSRSGSQHGLLVGDGRCGSQVRLREVRPADRRTLAGFDRAAEQEPGGYRHWATHRRGTSPAGDDGHFAIETLRNRTVVGSLWVRADPASGWFSYGVGIGAQHRRCGYAADAVTVLLSYMFEQQCYRKCEVSINGGNFASLALHSELGFREEGRPRDTELLQGEVRYPVLMGLTGDSFAARPSARERRRGRTRRRGRHWRIAAPAAHRAIPAH
ncbi:GNAT family N-acetyltransferase [Amycolatopsis panacis]|uniref:N-acetyltransferase n=1 Tax=Amycolatopsis panacis TaxID=2340917 RepID=A0A419I5V6_9PSEU|nr:GNAT family protein [Amycolatopsis panacis]RJQ86405.1 N-acetyltransferase [Amycolatopsis panacis]